MWGLSGCGLPLCRREHGGAGGVVGVWILVGSLGDIFSVALLLLHMELQLVPQLCDLEVELLILRGGEHRVVRERVRVVALEEVFQRPHEL